MIQVELFDQFHESAEKIFGILFPMGSDSIVRLGCAAHRSYPEINWVGGGGVTGFHPRVSYSDEFFWGIICSGDPCRYPA